MPLFGSSKKNPVEIVKNTRDAFNVLENNEHGKKSEKVGNQVKIVTFFLFKVFSRGFGLYIAVGTKTQMNKT